MSTFANRSVGVNCGHDIRIIFYESSYQIYEGETLLHNGRNAILECIPNKRAAEIYLEYYTDALKKAYELVRKTEKENKEVIWTLKKN